MWGGGRFLGRELGDLRAGSATGCGVTLCKSSAVLGPQLGLKYFAGLGLLAILDYLYLAERMVSLRGDLRAGWGVLSTKLYTQTAVVTHESLTSPGLGFSSAKWAW